MAIKYEENLSLTSFVCSTSGHTFFFLSFSTRWQYLLPGTVLVPTERVKNVTPTDWTQSDNAGGFMKLILPLQKSILTFLKKLPEAFLIFSEDEEDGQLTRGQRRTKCTDVSRLGGARKNKSNSKNLSTTKKQTGRVAGFTPEEQTNVINKCEELQEMTRAKQQHLLAIGLTNAFYGIRS